MSTGTRQERKFYYMKNSIEVEEYVRCSRDPIHFIRQHVRITHQERGSIPFKLFPFQIALIGVYLRFKRNITLKPRQMGISTLVSAYVLWLVLFHPHKIVSMISIKENIAKNLLRKIKFMYDKLPAYLQMELTADTAQRLSFANGSEINAEAATENAGRSEALSLLVMDEVAFQRYASGIWASAQPTLSTGGSAILLSTAFGMGNFFHDEYVRAIQGLNGFHAVRLNWRMHPERHQKWYLEQLAELGAKRLAQEVDCDFLQSGFNVFDMAKIKAIEERLKGKSFRESYGGQLKIYHEYDPTKAYFMGGDVASGKARDYSAFSIMDHTGVEVGCFKGKIGIREFAYLMMSTGKEFGEALLAPESNAIGEGVLATIQENGYRNVYNKISQTMKLDEFEKSESMVYGWLTTGKSRHEMITNMDDDLTQDVIEMNNPYFVQEAYSFVYAGMNNKPIAMGKTLGSKGATDMYEDENTKAVYTDDSIMAACITNEIRKSPLKYRGELLPYSR